MPVQATAVFPAARLGGLAGRARRLAGLAEGDDRQVYRPAGAAKRHRGCNPGPKATIDTSGLSVRSRTLPRMGRFSGWPEAAFDVLLQLDGDPSPSERELLRKDRERLVRQPMIELMHDVADADLAYDDFFVWGFAKMLWPWQRQVAVARLRRGVELSVSFDLDGLAVAATGWFGASGQVGQYRVAVHNERSGRELAAIIENLREAGFDVGGDRLKRVPRGYPAEHPRAELLRHRTLVTARSLGDENWLHTPQAVERVLAEFACLRPLTTWIDQHVVDG